MISGDQILPVITSNVSVHPNEPNANPLKFWMESHHRFMSIADNTFVLPAHNLPFYGIRERLQELIDHHEHRMILVEQACAEKPQIAKDLLPIMFEENSNRVKNDGIRRSDSPYSPVNGSGAFISNAR